MKENLKKSRYKYCLIVKNRDILKGVKFGVNVSLIIIHGSIKQLITTRKVPHNHMIIKLKSLI